ncbi:hypothetical protein KFL_002100040 [Klebsormidium nitens]|uniref:Limiting CO2-inducible protein B/C beta carbonyic anhydrase domain-containing protein n=1 Tax=Klebsormidium nitens TaxID=105231 RepID=A0A1Y1I1S9_KLENI|nr:hypothetical protein KFL_002100040 [Klebsormidium nitens]|eukprot:GAQ84874.1 hypothetical protein KFL_002100040 [Klebsormidium nitens]
MAAATHAAAGRVMSLESTVLGAAQPVHTEFAGLPLSSDRGRGNLLSTRRSSVWVPLNGQRVRPVCALNGSKNVSAPAQVSVEATPVPAQRPQTVASVQAAPPLAYVNSSQQYLPAVLVGAGLAAAFYALFGNKQQAPAPALAGNAPAAPAPPAPAPQPIVIKIEQPQTTSGGGSSVASKAAPTDATRKARDTMAKYFPVVQKDTDFLGKVSEALEDLGFNRNNCIALVDACRDEITRGLVQNIDEIYGESFNISGLGGYVNCGKTGLGAGMAHSPTLPDRDQDGKIREKYVFFAFPHVAVSADGAEGMVQRIGREKISSACGALIAIQGEAKGWSGDAQYPDDIEYTILRNKVLHKQSCLCNMATQTPSLMDVTKTALDVITEDLNDLLSKVVDPAKADFAVVTGIQIHAGTSEAPDDQNQFVDYVAPGTMYAVVNGQGYSLDWRWENGSVISKKMPAGTPDKVPALELIGAK